MNIEAVNPFWRDRSQSARRWARNLKIAREIPEKPMCARSDVVWEDFCELVTHEMSGLRCLDLTVWGDAMWPSLQGVFESGVLQLEPKDEQEFTKRLIERNLCDWSYTKQLLEHEGLRSAKVTWWGFRAGVRTFLAKWMLESCLLTEEMIREGEVVQGVVVWNGIGFDVES